jgi:hypothetical protein
MCKFTRLLSSDLLSSNLFSIGSTAVDAWGDAWGRGSFGRECGTCFCTRWHPTGYSSEHCPKGNKDK